MNARDVVCEYGRGKVLVSTPTLLPANLLVTGDVAVSKKVAGLAFLALSAHCRASSAVWRLRDYGCGGG
jgi:hypothetical protein